MKSKYKYEGGSDDPVKGFDDLAGELEELAKKAEGSALMESLKKSAEALEKDVRAMPKPRSRIAVAGYTHLLDSVGHSEEGSTLLVGWRKYYGRMVESGTKKMSAQAHLIPTWERNESRYMEIITKQFGG